MELKSTVTGILVAIDTESQLLEESILDEKEEQIATLKFITGQIKGKPIVLARTGVGKVNAAMVTTLLICNFKPDHVIFTGVAGGINPELKTGDIVLAEKTVQHDLGRQMADKFTNISVPNPISGKKNPIYFPADDRLLRLAEKTCYNIEFTEMDIGGYSRTPKVIKGLVVTGDTAIISSSRKKQLRDSLQADAVEMEGAAVAQICHQFDIPCLVIRSISDSADENAQKDFNEFCKIAARNSARIVVDMIEHFYSDTLS
jgi:adenosylhomocysteine nucleosidase